MLGYVRATFLFGRGKGPGFRLRCPVCFLAMARLRRTPTAAHAYALLHLPQAAQSNAAYETFPGGSLHTLSPERKYDRPTS